MEFLQTELLHHELKFIILQDTCIIFHLKLGQLPCADFLPACVGKVQVNWTLTQNMMTFTAYVQAEWQVYIDRSSIATVGSFI